MKTRHKILLLATMLLPAVIYSGCSSSQKPLKIVLPPDFEEQPAQSAANQKRFQQKENAPSALDSAVQLSEKYAHLSTEASELKQQNKNLHAENQQLRESLKSARTELNATQKELSEANNLLMEMRVELNNWKNDVLSFRDEMRQADITQLQTLQKILEILGGEVPGELVAAETRQSPDSSVGEPNQP